MNLNNDESRLREELQRDAARIPVPPFDPVLHHAAIRRIRALAKPQQPAWWPALSAVAAVLVLAMVFTHFPARPIQSPLVKPVESVASLPSTTVWAYRQVVAQGEDALLDRLAEDARRVLPTSTPIVASLIN